MWNTRSTEDLSAYRRLLKEANGYCLNCNRVLSYSRHYLCSRCIVQLKTKGLEDKRVSFRSVGLNTINYQQRLHRVFFGCNAPLAYRGNKEDRIVTSLSQETINKACAILHNYLLNTTTIKRQKDIYLLIKDSRNTLRRILYSLSLYAISYHILNNKDFRSESHYLSSINRQLDNDMMRMYVRMHPDMHRAINNTRDRTMKQLLHQVDVIAECVGVVLSFE